MSEPTTGKFFESLRRNNAKIREDRALTISEDAELMFKRTVEDIESELKRKTRDRDNMLDMSPTSADSLVLASDFDAKSFVEKDLELGIQIRQLKIKLEVAKERYSELFVEQTEA